MSRLKGGKKVKSSRRRNQGVRIGKEKDGRKRGGDRGR